MYMIPIKIETIFGVFFLLIIDTFVLLTGCSMFIPKDILKEDTLLNFNQGGVHI